MDMFISQERPINQLESFKKPRILIVMKLELICTIILWSFPICPSILGLEHSRFEFASLVQYLQKLVVFFSLDRFDRFAPNMLWSFLAPLHAHGRAASKLGFDRITIVV